jgi:hypothetical protein
MFIAPGHPLNMDIVTSVRLPVDQNGQAAGAHPQALSFPTTREQRGRIFSTSTPETGLGYVFRRLLGLTFFHRRFIEGHRLSLLDAQRPGGAHSQAESGTIAQLLVQHSGFAIHHLYRALGAGDYAHPTTVAQLLFNPNYLTRYHSTSVIHVLSPKG